MEPLVNGLHDREISKPERPLRFVFFGRSIVSDWENPTAITSRAILRALNNLGHETRFLEERGNQPTVDLLRARGSAPLRAFTKEFPDIVYRTYELPRGIERTLWLARELGDVDAVVALNDAPPEVLDELSRVPLPRLVRIVAMTDDGQPPFAPDILLTRNDFSAAKEGADEEFDASSLAANLITGIRSELASRR
jgi:hypothetical protein